MIFPEGEIFYSASLLWYFPYKILNSIWHLIFSPQKFYIANELHEIAF